MVCAPLKRLLPSALQQESLKRVKNRKFLQFQGPLNGGVSNRGVSSSGLVLPFLSFFVLICPFCPFLDFPDFSGMVRGFSRFVPFLSRPIKSTYEEQSRKAPRHNLDLSRKNWETPPVWKPPGLASPFNFLCEKRLPRNGRSGCVSWSAFQS